MSPGDLSGKRIGEILIEKGFLQEEQLKKALELQRQTHNRLGQTLIFLGFITEDQLAECMAQQLGIPYLAVRTHEIPEEMIAKVNADVAKRFCILPLDCIGKILTVALTDALAPEEIAELEKITGYRLKFYFITQSDFKTAFGRFYPGQSPAA